MINNLIKQGLDISSRNQIKLANFIPCSKNKSIYIEYDQENIIKKLR